MNPAKKYSSIKYGLSILDTVFELACLLIFLRLGLSKGLALEVVKFAGNSSLSVALYVLVILIGYYLLSLPLNFYRSYVLEHKFSLSTQRVGDWAADQVKAGILSYVISVIVIAAFFFILERFADTWWLVISLFWIFFSLLLARIMPVIIIPLFFRYKKLSDDELRQRIMSLAERMKVKLLDCFEIDFSRKTLKANAAFVGLGKTKRVILADTLKDKYSYDEIEVILAHEFAHYKLRHLLKLLFVNSAAIILAFYLISRTSLRVLEYFGFNALSDLAALPVIFLYFIVLGIITQPIENYVSRRLEQNADRMALTATAHTDAFISMMDKLASQNLADRNPHPLIKFYFLDHPPIDERIKMAQSFK